MPPAGAVVATAHVTLTYLVDRAPAIFPPPAGAARGISRG